LSANFGGLLRPVHPHLFRHQMITYLTGDLSDTQIQPDLCHESKKSLEIYQHLSLDAVEQAYEEAVGFGASCRAVLT
jgi:integrase/recombinase XerD